ncbi:hypothetical protein C8R46DRAFT_910726, partial [Mycena filopes]
YSAIAGDGGPNVRVCKRLIVTLFPWILNIYDPCHNLNLFMKDLGALFKKDLVVVSGLSNYFGKSNYGTYHLTQERKKMNITEGMKSASETRFSTTYIQSLAVHLCMPAINSLFRSGILRFDTKAVCFLGETTAHYEFMANLSTMIQLLAAPANAILTLEGQNTTCADVFYVWVCIAWQLEKVMANSASSAGRHRAKVVQLYNTRFEQMMNESSYNVFLLSYFLHPSEFIASHRSPTLTEPHRVPEIRWSSADNACASRRAITEDLGVSPPLHYTVQIGDANSEGRATA